MEDWPNALPCGHNSRATLSETTTTAALAVRSSDLNARPCRMAISSTPKNSGDTNLYTTGDLPPADPAPGAVSANAARGRSIGSGHAAATIATAGSAATARTMASRLGSLLISTTMVSDVRMPGSVVAAAIALRRNTAEQISSRADAVTCRPMSTFRERRGRASRVTSPRIVRTSSRRVDWSAGVSPKNAVETTAPTARNASTRQSQGGTARLTTSEISSARVLTTA